MAIIETRWLRSFTIIVGLMMVTTVSACQGEAADMAAQDNAEAPLPVETQNIGSDMTSTFNLPTCEEMRASASDEYAMADQFDKTYPQSLVGEASVEQVDLTANDIEEVVTYLTCAAAISNYDIGVVESSLALFASERHGKDSFAALDQLAAGSSENAKNAQELAVKIRQFLAGPAE